MNDTNARSIRERTYSISEECVELFNGQQDAMQIWLFAMTRAEDWVFRKSHIQGYLKISRNRWRAAVKYLSSIGLLEIRVVKNTAGKFFGKRYEFYSLNMRDKKVNSQVIENSEEKEKGDIPHCVVTKNVTTKINKNNYVAEGTNYGSSVLGSIYLSVGGCKGGMGDMSQSGADVSDEIAEQYQRRFLKHFTGVKTFQTFDDSKDKRKGVTKVFHNDTSKLNEINSYGGGIFLTINETDGNGRKRDNITRIRAIFVDLDGSPLEPVLEYDPHLVVETSQGKFHCYWFVKDFPLDAFGDTQKRLAEMFKGDPVVHDLSRVMRIPGFWHQKGEPFFSKIILESYYEPMDYADVVKKFPPKPVKKWSKPRYKETVEDSDYKGEYGTSNGHRNNGLMRFVGGMMKRKKSWDFIESEAWKWGKGCQPPLPDHEITALLRSAERYRQ